MEDAGVEEGGETLELGEAWFEDDGEGVHAKGFERGGAGGGRLVVFERKKELEGSPLMPMKPKGTVVRSVST